jgi:hypothetical protein
VFLWKDISGDLSSDSIVVITASAEYVAALTQASDRIWYRPMSDIKATLSPTATGVAPGDLPTAFALLQNYPNPFNPSTTIGYEVPVTSNVRMVVYDLLGREITVLVDEKKTAGRYAVRFDASLLASGVYFSRMQFHPLALAPERDATAGAGDVVRTRMLMLLR